MLANFVRKHLNLHRFIKVYLNLCIKLVYIDAPFRVIGTSALVEYLNLILKLLDHFQIFVVLVDLLFHLQLQILNANI